MAIATTHSLRNTWNKGIGKYNDLVDSLSSRYTIDIVTQKAILGIQIKKQNFTCTLGSDIGFSKHQQTDLQQDTSIHYQNLYLFPHLNAQYNLKPSLSFNFIYLGSSQPPSFSLLQPIRNNNDPLNIILGNPALRPAFSQSFGLGMKSENSAEGWSQYTGINFGIIVNSFSSRSFIDSLGRTVVQNVKIREWQ